jgi:hypothetical protein
MERASPKGEALRLEVHRASEHDGRGDQAALRLFHISSGGFWIRVPATWIQHGPRAWGSDGFSLLLWLLEAVDAEVLLGDGTRTGLVATRTYREVPTGKALTVAGIAAALGMSERATRRALHRLLEAKMVAIETDSRGLQIALPNSNRELPDETTTTRRRQVFDVRWARRHYPELLKKCTKRRPKVHKTGVVE